MKRFAAMLLALCACFAFAAVAEEPSSMSVGGDVVIAADGSVRDCTVNGAPTPALRALVEQSVRKSQFEPIVRDGKPIVARTSYSLKLVATPVGAGYSIRVERIGFYVPRKVLKQPMPHLFTPQDLDILAAIRVDATGKVVDSAVLAIQTIVGDDAVLDKKLLEKAFRTSLKQWRYEPARTDLGDPGVFSGTIRFTIARSNSEYARSPWRTPTFVDAKPIPWDAARPVDGKALQEGMLASIDDAVKLRTEVVGKPL